MGLKKLVPTFIKNYHGFVVSDYDKTNYSGRRIATFFDMLHCYLHFHVTPSEYDFYKFYNYKDIYRCNFLVKHDQYLTYDRINGNLFHGNGEGGKSYQYTLFGKELIGRDWIRLNDNAESLEKIKDFVKSHNKVLFKPRCGSLGIGVFVYEDKGNDADLVNVFQKIYGRDYLCEEYIVQNHEIAEFHSSSVNTVRIVTLNDNGNIKIIASSLKIGVGDCVVDNIRHEGIGASIDIDSGIIYTPGYDFSRNKYYFHPESKKKIIGFEVPNWEKAKQIAIKGAEISKYTRLIGWDIAITEDGACIVEKNSAPGTRIIQMYDMIPKGKPVFDYISNNKIPQLSKKRKKAILKSKFGM